MRQLKLFGLWIGILALGGPANAVTIVDFEDWTGGPSPQDSVVSHGYAVHGLVSVYPDQTTNNPSNALHVSEQSAKMIATDLSPFHLVRLDLQEGIGSTGTVAIELVAHLEGQSDAIETFYLDGDPATFQTFYPTGFCNVRQVHFYAYGVQGGYASGLSLDNVVVAVPEPDLMALISLGMLAATRTLRRVS